MSDPADPKGRRALFADQPSPPPQPAEEGRRAFYSPPDTPEPTGGIPIECSRCGERSRVSRVDLARRVLSMSLWAPWRGHSRWITCPACGRRAWCRVRWVRPPGRSR